MNLKDLQPPKWPLKFLRFFLKKEYIEEVEGDMEEIFREDIERSSLSHARRNYAWQIVKLCRPILLKSLTQLPSPSPYAMFSNYSKTSIRSLMKNPLSSFINIFGLSVAIGICLVVYSFMDFDSRIDQFHKNKNEVFLVTFTADRDGKEIEYGTSPRPLAEMLKGDFANIDKVCRVEDRNAVLKHSDNVFHENIRYVDPTFLEMFSFPLKWGTPGSLADINSVILSETAAVKYFGSENPVGKDLLIIFGENNSKAFKVGGVANAFPKAHAIEFNVLLNFQNIHLAESAYDATDWGKFVSATLIQVQDPADVTYVKQRMDKYRSLQNQAEDDWAISTFSFEPIATLHERSSLIRDDISFDDNVEGRIGMPIIAIFMLSLACFNYINIAIVSAAKRLKEIGVRKAIGANRTKVIIQFLTENIVITFFALVIGVLLGALIFIPWFTQFSGWDLEINVADSRLWIFLVVLLVTTGILSGIYPAFYISKFDAVKIFKGSLQFGRKNPITKTFLGIQLVLACITITAAVVFTQNNDYQYNRGWGYDQKNAMYVNVPDQAAFDKLHAAMMRDPNVLLLSGSKDHVGKNNSTSILRTASGRVYEVNRYDVAADYFQTMGLALVSGRTFQKAAESESRKLVVNEMFVRNLNLSQPLGQQFEMDSVKFEIVGILKDFHANSFFNEMQPAVFTLVSEQDYRYLSMKVAEGSANDTFDKLRDQWTSLYPEIPFQGGHQQDVWISFFDSVDRSQTFNNILASIAVLLAGLGLYGLVTLNVSGRVREFSIRKTMGAGLKNIAGVIMKQYVVLTTLALLVGAPISYLFTKAYLDMLFAYPIPMSYSGVSIAVAILIVVLFAVIATQIRRVARANPIDGLKIE
jgi:ABC-type antimicrobial peptide transport system permease subunit